ncbi:MAG TPA: hypothetical protein VGC69_17695 [Bordetella sp.]
MRWGIWLIAFAIVIGACVASTGAFIVDEVVYQAGVDAFQHHHTLILENGYGTFRAESLTLWLLAEGPHGLTPQYPVGTAIAGGVLAPLLGARSLIFFNALASVGTLFLVRALARILFNREEIAWRAVLILALATYWPEFTVGIWPHAISVFGATATLLCAWLAITRDSQNFRWATLSGLCMGLGLLFRLDAILCLPIAGLATMLFAPRRAGILLAGCLVGILPGLITTSLTNQFKFGTYNPFSYGNTVAVAIDNATLSGQTGAILLVLLLGATLIALHWLHRSKKLGKVHVLASLGLLFVIALAIPATREVLSHYMTGAQGLIWDATTIIDPHDGVVKGAYGTLSFWGMAKKAWAQSLPWLGLLFFLVCSRWKDADREPIAFILMGITLWTLPFILHLYHGALGSNMRYFLPALPLAAILAAKVWEDLIVVAGQGGKTTHLATLGRWAVIIVFVAWSFAGPATIYGANQIFPNYLFAALGLLCLLAGREGPHRILFARMAIAFGVGGFMAAGIFNIMDLSVSQAHRHQNRLMNEAFAKLPSPSLFLALPEGAMHQIGHPDTLVAVADPIHGKVDGTLLTQALNKGYRVFVIAPWLAQALASSPQLKDAGEVKELGEPWQDAVHELVDK